MTGFPDAADWRAGCAADAVLGTWAGPWSVCFAVTSGSDTTIFNFVDGQVAADPGYARLHPGGARGDMGPVSRTRSAASPSRHLRDDVPVAGIFHSRRPTCLHAARPCRAAGARDREVAGLGSRTAGAGVAASPRRRPSGARGHRPLCAGDRRRRNLSDLQRVGGIGAGRAVHAHRRRRRAAIPWPDGRSAHRRSITGWYRSTCPGTANRRRRRARSTAPGG